MSLVVHMQIDCLRLKAEVAAECDLIGDAVEGTIRHKIHAGYALL